MNKNLLILGAGQYGYVAKEIAEAMGKFTRIDFLDDNNPIAIGKLSDYERFSTAYTCAVVSIGNPQIRLDYLKRLSGKFQIITLSHPQSYISVSAKVGCGCIIEPMAVIHANVTVANGCLISAGAVINHNACINEGCHIDCNSTIGARTIIPAGTKVQCGDTIII